MSDKIIQIIKTTQEALQKDASKAQAEFSSSSKLGEGFHSQVTLRDHKIEVDEPEALGGTDKAPNPVELILAALGTCHEITYRAYALALGIPVKTIRAEIKGKIDLRGFFGVSEEVRAGFNNIEGSIFIETDASEEELEKLRKVVTDHCPVYDIIKNTTQVNLELVKEKV
jgi:uncharacterized OsmC-like protein